MGSHIDQGNAEVRLDRLTIRREGDVLQLIPHQHDHRYSLDALGAYIAPAEQQSWQNWVLTGGEPEYGFPGWCVFQDLSRMDAEAIARTLRIGFAAPELM